LPIMELAIQPLVFVNVLQADQVLIVLASFHKLLFVKMAVLETALPEFATVPRDGKAMTADVRHVLLSMAALVKVHVTVMELVHVMLDGQGLRTALARLRLSLVKEEA